MTRRHSATVRRAEHVIGDAEVRRGEQIFSVPVVLKRSGFADERIDP